jgi:transposase
MPISPDQLPDDIAALKQLLMAKDAELVAAKNGLVVTQLTIEKLKAQLAKFRREKFGATSEKIERAIAQLELALEDAQSAMAESEAATPPSIETTAQPAASPEPPKKRRQLPAELPRRNVVHTSSGICKGCGGTDLRIVGESITEVLEYVPARFEVIRHVRPACSCRKCETMVQAPMPELPIPRGIAGPGLLAHIITAKFCDHLPLYRQSEIFARAGIDLDRGLLAEWLGHISWLVRPLVDLIATHVMAGNVIHADDTPVPVLAPGAGKTKTGRQWVYLRDERPHGSATPPAVLYRYTPDRKGEHCQKELAGFTGWLHADGYSGFAKLYEDTGAPGAPGITEVACWAHVRRGFFDEYARNKAPIAKEALDKIGALFDIERTVAGRTPDIRRDVRQRTARSRLEELAAWLDAQLQVISGKSDLAKAIRYARSRWEALTRYVDNGWLEISNNAAENQIRPVKLGAKNWLFAGSDAGGERAATFYTLIRTAKLNGLEPEAYLHDVLTRIGAHPVNRLDELLPWAWAASTKTAKLAA